MEALAWRRPSAAVGPPGYLPHVRVRLVSHLVRPARCAALILRDRVRLQVGPGGVSALFPPWTLAVISSAGARCAQPGPGVSRPVACAHRGLEGGICRVAIDVHRSHLTVAMVAAPLMMLRDLGWARPPSAGGRARGVVGLRVRRSSIAQRARRRPGVAPGPSIPPHPVPFSPSHSARPGPSHPCRPDTAVPSHPCRPGQAVPFSYGRISDSAMGVGQDMVPSRSGSLLFRPRIDPAPPMTLRRWHTPRLAGSGASSEVAKPPD